MASSKNFTVFCFLFISICFYIAMWPMTRNGQTIGEYFSQEEDSVVTAPSQAQIIRTWVDKDNGKLNFKRHLLPSPIEDIKAVAIDSVHLTYIFSGGRPNQLISYNKELNTFEIIAYDVVHVSSMDTDHHKNLLHLVDEGKKTYEIMDLKTYKRKVVEENFTYNDIGLLLFGSGGLPKMNLNSFHEQREKILGKVFTIISKFSGPARHSVFLGRNSVTDTAIFANWDGTRVTIEKKVGHVGYVGNLNGLEIEGNVFKDMIYVSNINGLAVVAI